jgi:enoyl-CoA hydratase/carnithine racemase
MALVPDGGSTFTLPRLIGLGRALRLLLASETLDATQALAMGLVEEVAEDDALDAAVRRLLHHLNAGDPLSLRAMKRLTRAAEIGALEQALAAEGALQLAALQDGDFQRRLEAFAARTGASTPRP